MQSRLFHAIVAAGLSLGGAAAVAVGCSDPIADGRNDGEAGIADVTAPDAVDDVADATAPDDATVADAADGSLPFPGDAAVDGDAGWPTTK
jgi:hypothetical protein